MKANRTGREQLTCDQRIDIVEEFLLGKSGGVIARKYKISSGYVRQLTWLYKRGSHTHLFPSSINQRRTILMVNEGVDYNA